MKILSVNVQSFGKLKNVDFDFSDGVTVLRNSNGFGKTTLANFIRAMLYGFSKTKYTSERMNDASRYAPWNSNERFGGSMTVERDGEQYRIERFFGKTAKAETLAVTNVKTGKPLYVSGSLGEYFLGLTMESYDRSAYFPQEAVELSANENFDAKLANLVSDGVEDLDKVQKKLADYKKYFRHKIGSGGKINELCEQRRNCQRELNDAEQAERRAREISARLAAIEGEKAQLAQKQRALREQLNLLNRKIAQSEPSEEEKQARQKLAELNERISRFPAEFDDDKKRCDDLDKQIASLHNDVKPKVYPNLPLFIAAMVLVVAGIALEVAGLIILQTIGLILCILGAVIAVTGGVLVYVAYRRKGAKTLVAGEYDALVSQYYTIASKYVYTGNVDFDEVRRMFWQAYSQYRGDVRVRDELQSTVSAKTDNSDLTEQAANTQAEEERVAEAFARLSQEQGSLTAEQSAQRTDKTAIQDKILSLSDEIDDMERKFRIATKVEELLIQAKDNLSTSYLPRLRVRCQELLEKVTDSKYQVDIDREFSVRLRENRQTKPMSEFSRGIREITLLCFRLALSELLFDGEIPFLIIDDAFVNYDENNFLRATDLLAELSARTQIIYFTCHSRLGNLLNRRGSQKSKEK